MHTQLVNQDQSTNRSDSSNSDTPEALGGSGRKMADILRDLFEITLKGFTFVCKLLVDIESCVAGLLSLVAIWRLFDILPSLFNASSR